MVMKQILKLALAILVLAMAGCTKDDPDVGGDIKPDSKVDDPTGTILISMRNGNNGGTSLDGLEIGKDDNFYGGSGWSIASVGNVRGLGNVSTIPASGWSDKVSVVPGAGYVAYNRSNDTFYRLYVVEYIEAAVTGGIIGAEVKYQKPFKGLDQDIKPDKSAVVFTSQGGNEQVVFDNNSIVPFEVTSSEEWCQVKKASTRNEYFLYDAILISADESFSAVDQTAEIKIRTLYNKETVISVTRKAKGEFITPSQSEVAFFNYDKADSQYVTLFTNLETSDILVKTDVDWISAEIQDRANMAVRRIVSVDGETMHRSVSENQVNKTLAITCQPNSGEKREGRITLSYGKVSENIVVTQEGSGFRIFADNVEIEADENLIKTVGYHSGNLSWSYIGFEYENGCDEWLLAKVEDYQNISFTAKVNPDTKKRTGKVKLIYKRNGNQIDLVTVNVVQQGMKYEDIDLFLDRCAQNLTITYPLPEGTKVISSESWCSATPSGETLVFRVSGTADNRSAVISFSGIDAKIYVSQSKYKTGDSYSENGIEGRVCSMVDGVGIVYKLLGYAIWSKENIDLKDASSALDGVANMKTVMNIPDWKNLYPAFMAVDRLNKNGVIGWYFPAKDQLKAAANVIEHYCSDDGFSESVCWSSTNYNVNTAIYVVANSANSSHKNEKHLIPAFYNFSYNFNKK